MVNFFFGVLLGAIVMMAYIEPTKLADSFHYLGDKVEEKSNATDPALSSGP